MGGFEVLVAEDGRSALHLARAYLPDLMISDINMPGTNGLQTLEQLRGDPATDTIPFILMTGEGNAQMRPGMDLGADDFLRKPFTMKDLLKAVTVRLGKQERVRQAAETKLKNLRCSLSKMLPHELNTPLFGILGTSEMIRNYADSLDVAELKEMADIIMDSGRRLQRLIQNFLLYSQLETIRDDKQAIDAMRSEATSDAERIIAEAGRAEAEAAERSGDLKMALSPGRAGIGEEYLAKIVSELVGNSFKFSGQGSPVTVVSRKEPGWFTLEVSDQGRGMNREQIRNIEPLTQFERSIHEQQGSGLGLVIARNLVELHGGRFSLKSTEGRVTEISVSFRDLA